MRNMKAIYLILIGAFCITLACGQGGNIEPAGVLGGGGTGYGKNAPVDGDGEPSSIVGTWRYDRVDYSEILIFNDDGTFSITVYEEGQISISYDGTYVISGNEVTLYFSGASTTFTFSITDNTLTITYQGESTIYYRVTH